MQLPLLLAAVTAFLVSSVQGLPVDPSLEESSPVEAPATVVVDGAILECVGGHYCGSSGGFNAVLPCNGGKPKAICKDKTPNCVRIDKGNLGCGR